MAESSDASRVPSGDRRDSEFTLSLSHGRSATIRIPPPGIGPSFFAFGIIKGGHRMFNRIIIPLARMSGLTPFSVTEQLRNQDIHLSEAEVPSNLFRAEGYAYIGFGNLPDTLSLPSGAPAVVFLRDPRDALTSLYFSVAQSHPLPDTEKLRDDFAAQRTLALSQHIDDFVLDRAEFYRMLVNQILDRLPCLGHKLYRYEDVIFDKLEWAMDMAAFLKLNVSEEYIRAVVRRIDIRPSVEDPAAPIRRVTPGDHLDKLRPDTIRKLNDILREPLLRLGYMS
jgi:hypothetical protein